ncbi:hypothetical protein [Clostridium sp. LIBA-8841]|uniref:hypothetical protein n=1 Tax=Clostridium sp. LIBA-8841 TaxID=2987530 RepID=UPI002AC72ADD|nr:hypothetical protein [Clostridium sp. LIBA-8841]MDZ5252184.1 hypothetical protein [Clostridium sp. LIBA-8841]
MKKLRGIVFSLIPLLFLVGCESIEKNETKLVYEKLSQKEEYLLNLTDNKILTYKIENIPKDKSYEINLIYEVYREGKKIKEEIIMGSISEEGHEESKEKTLGINFKDGNKIRCVLGDEGTYSTASHDIEENLWEYVQAYFTNDITLEEGKSVYIYHANSGEYIQNSVLGMNTDSNILNEILKNNEVNIFLKLSLKEF